MAYKQALDTLHRATEHLHQLQAEVKHLTEELKRVVLTGEPTDPIRARQAELKNMIHEEQIRITAHQQAADQAFPAHARARIEQLQRESAERSEAGNRQWAALKKLEKEYFDFKSTQNDDANTRRRQNEAARAEIVQLEKRIRELEGGIDDA